MPDSILGPDQPAPPDGIEFDPFEMDWPWPGMKSEIDETSTPSIAPQSPAPPQLP